MIQSKKLWLGECPGRLAILSRLVVEGWAAGYEEKMEMKINDPFHLNCYFSLWKGISTSGKVTIVLILYSSMLTGSIVIKHENTPHTQKSENDLFAMIHTLKAYFKQSFFGENFSQSITKYI